MLHTHKFSRKWSNLMTNPSIALSISTGIYAPYFQVEGTTKLFDAGPQHDRLESIYTKQHRKAASLAGDITTGSIEVSPCWIRYYDWPRESGRCQEWLVYESINANAPEIGIVLRNGLSSDVGKLTEFTRSLGSLDTLHENGFKLIAECNDKVIGLLSFDEPPVNAYLACRVYLNSACFNQNIIESLFRVAKRVAHPYRCVAKVSANNLSRYISCGLKDITHHAKNASLFAAENECIVEI